MKVQWVPASIKVVLGFGLAAKLGIPVAYLSLRMVSNLVIVGLRPMSTWAC